MISAEIEFHAPSELPEALDLLAERGDDVTVLAGGMSLVPMMNLGIVKPEVVMSLNHVAELERVQEDGTSFRIGATVCHASIARDDVLARDFPALVAAAQAIGDVQVRNRGTVGGSIAHADPAADYLPVLSLVGAMIGLRSRAGHRALPLDEFLIDMMFTARQQSELVTEIVVQKPPLGSGFSYRRLARVEGSFPIVNAAALVEPSGSSARLALGGVGPKPLVLDVTEHLGDGATAQALEAIGEAAYEASSATTGDVISDAEYRREMARVFAQRAVRAADAAAESAEPGL